MDPARIWRIAVERAAFGTADSVGVGTTLSRLLKLPGVKGVEGEGGLFVVVPARCGLSFRLRHDLAPSEHKPEWTSADLKRLPASTVVDQVLLFGCSKDRR